MNYQVLIYLYARILRDLEHAPDLSDPVFKRKLRQVKTLSIKIKAYESAITNVVGMYEQQ